VTVAILLGLGTWQLQRKAWKDDLLRTIDERAHLPPLTRLESAHCRPDAGLLDPCEFRPVRLTGRFDHAGERHVFISVPLQADGIGGAGFWVFTPFRTTAGPVVWVNRGFVPERLKAADLRAAGQTADDVTIDGLMRRAEARGTFSGRNDPAKNIYFVRAPDEFMAPDEVMGLDRSEPTPRSHAAIWRTHYLDQTGPAMAGTAQLQTPLPLTTLPRPLVGRIAIPNRHLEYALTWYAFAVTLLAVVFFYRRGRHAVNDG
jgi:surfeit locus 1 family protein